MARERLVTRTIEVSEVEIMTVNLDTKEVSNVFVILNSLPKDITDSQIMAQAKEQMVENLVPVSVISKDTTEVVYGMPEKDFIAFARIITR